MNGPEETELKWLRKNRRKAILWGIGSSLKMLVLPRCLSLLFNVATVTATDAVHCHADSSPPEPTLPGERNRVNLCTPEWSYSPGLGCSSDFADPHYSARVRFCFSLYQLGTTYKYWCFLGEVLSYSSFVVLSKEWYGFSCGLVIQSLPIYSLITRALSISLSSRHHFYFRPGLYLWITGVLYKERVWYKWTCQIFPFLFAPHMVSKSSSTSQIWTWDCHWPDQ